MFAFFLTEKDVGHSIMHSYFSVSVLKVIQRRAPPRAADDAQGHWVVDDGTHFASQL